MRKETLARYLDALSEAGKHTDAYFRIEERLTLEESEQLKVFIGFLGDNEAPLGPLSIHAKLREASNATPQLKRIYLRKFKSMCEAIRTETFRKYDAFANEVLKSGASLELHKVGYPLKNVEVVSYDSETKQIILKIK